MELKNNTKIKAEEQVEIDNNLNSAELEFLKKAREIALEYQNVYNQTKLELSSSERIK